MKVESCKFFDVCMDLLVRYRLYSHKFNIHKKKEMTREIHESYRQISKPYLKNVCYRTATNTTDLIEVANELELEFLP